MPDETSGSPSPGRPPRAAAVWTRRARDRHGRGLRGPLAPPSVPLARGGSQRFDQTVLDVVDDVEERLLRAAAAGPDEIDVETLRRAIDEIEFGVEDVPSPEVVQPERGELAVLGRTEEADRTHGPRVIVYRRPLERRGRTDKSLESLLADVLLELVLEAIGIDPGSWDTLDDPDS